MTVVVHSHRFVTMRLPIEANTPGLAGDGTPLYTADVGDIFFRWWLNVNLPFDGGSDEGGLYVELAPAGARGDDVTLLQPHNPQLLPSQGHDRRLSYHEPHYISDWDGLYFSAKTELVVRFADVDGAVPDPLPTEGAADFGIIVLRAWS